MTHRQQRRLIRVEIAYYRQLARVMIDAHIETMRIGAPLATSAEVGQLLNQRRAAWRATTKKRRDRIVCGIVLERSRK